MLVFCSSQIGWRRYQLVSDSLQKFFLVGIDQRMSEQRHEVICHDNDIATLRNEQATKANMVKAFKQLAARCKQGDIVYIHYSGHGQLMTDLDGDEAMRWTGRHSEWDESWIPYDAYMTYCPQDHGERHFSDDEVAVFLQQIRRRIGSIGQLIVAIDACHSGDATCGDDDECVRGVDIKFNIPRRPGTPSAKPIEEQWLTISACKPTNSVRK